MKSKVLIEYLEKIDNISPDTEIKLFVNDNVYDVGFIRSDGMIFGVNRDSFNDTADSTDKLMKQLRKAREKAKRWKRKYLELRYKVDHSETESENMSRCKYCKYAIMDYYEYYDGGKQYFVHGCQKGMPGDSECEEYDEDETNE